MDTDRLIPATDGLCIRDRLHRLIDDLEMIMKQMGEIVTFQRDDRGVAKDLNAIELARLFKIKEEELERTMEIAVQQAERQKVIEQLEAEVRKRDEYLLKIRNCLRDSESLMTNAIFQANQKLKSIALANHQKVSAEDLIRYAHRISACNAVAAPLTWQQGDPQRPFPIDAEMRSGLLAREPQQTVPWNVANRVGAAGDFQQVSMSLGPQSGSMPSTPTLMGQPGGGGGGPPPGMHPFMAPVAPPGDGVGAVGPGGVFTSPMHRPFSPTAGASMYHQGSPVMMPPRSMPGPGWVAQRALTPPNVSPRALRLPPHMPPPPPQFQQQHSTPPHQFGPMSPMGGGGGVSVGSPAATVNTLGMPPGTPQAMQQQQQHHMMQTTPPQAFHGHHQFGPRVSPQLMHNLPPQQQQVRAQLPPQMGMGGMGPTRQTSPGAAASIQRMIKQEQQQQSQSDTVELLSSDSSSSSSSDSPE